LANNATIIGTGSDPLVSGSTFYVYYAYFPTFPVNSWSDAVLARRLVSCEPTARAKTTLAVDIGVNLADDTQTATVTLTDGSARPVVGASVELTWTPLEGRGTRATYQTTGVVPAGYSKALVQVNYNQSVLRPGPIDLALYDVRYGEAGAAPRTIPNGAFAQAMNGWYASEPGTVQIARDNDGTRSLVISASASRSGLVNGSPFQVTPGAAYVFEISARVAGSSADLGGFALIFLKEIEGSRKTIPFAAPRIGARGLTDSAGQFRLTQLPKTRVRVVARYEGDASHWPAEYAWAER